jgi:large subunit ribosomal protein L6
MSRIGKNPISIPEGVSVEIQSNVVVVKGKLGELSQSFDTVTVEKIENTLVVSRSSDSKPMKAKHGLYRSLFSNMIQGVNTG